MASSTDLLVALLDLEPLEQNIYRGQNRDIGSGRIFGGQVLAQALVAARRTIDEADRTAHSLHAYFILEGDLDIPVVYFVDRLRDGRSFTTRRVTAIQHGRAIFTLSASFHRTEEGLTHQAAMPDIPPPEDLRSEVDIFREQSDRLPAHLRSILTQDRPLEFRPVEPFTFLDRTPRPPHRCIWIRSPGALPDNPVYHQGALAYASDYGLLSTALQPHGRTVRDTDIMAAFARPLALVPPPLPRRRLASLYPRQPRHPRLPGVRDGNVLHPRRAVGRFGGAGGPAANRNQAAPEAPATAGDAQ